MSNIEKEYKGDLKKQLKAFDAKAQLRWLEGLPNQTKVSDDWSTKAGMLLNIARQLKAIGQATTVVSAAKKTEALKVEIARQADHFAR